MTSRASPPNSPAVTSGAWSWTTTQWVAGQVAHGSPEPMARFLLGTFLAAREGRFAGVDPLLGDLLGRPPRTVRDLLAGLG